MVIQVHGPCQAAEFREANCDPGLNPAGGTEVAYTNRGDRCEGIYVQEVSGGALEIVSFTENGRSYKFTRENPLLLEWPTVGGADTRVRASSLKRKLYYRMDTVRPPKSAAFNWPSDILSRLDISRAEIGMLAWTEHPIAGVQRKIHLPLRVTRQPTPALSEQETNAVAESYKLVLLSDVELDEVYFTLRPLDRNGRAGNPIFSNRKLDKGYYPAAVPISFPLSFSELTNSETGFYSLSVGAELRNSEPRIIPEFWFYHADPAKPRTPQAGGQP